MRIRATLAIALGLTFASYALPQESAAQQQAASEKPGQTVEPSSFWDWANFVLLAAVLGYIMRKSLPPLFRKQTDEIQAALAEAAKVKQDAAAFAASVERRLENLQREIEVLRKNAHDEMKAEGERLSRETERHLHRIREQAAQEIELMTRGAKDALRRYAAELSVRAAEERIRARMNPEQQEGLVGAFLQDLHERIGPRAAGN